MRFVLLVFAISLCAGSVAAQTATFTDTSRAANVHHRTTPAVAGDLASQWFSLERWLGPGTATADFDNDGWLELFVVGDGGLSNALYHNNGDGTFTDVASIAGIVQTGKGRGTVFFDYDNDGWRDLYITCAGPNFLYRNNGDGTFTDVTEVAGVGGEKHSASAAVADYDHDGWLDLYVVNWANKFQLREGYALPTNALYRNRGDGTFEDVSQMAGVADDGVGWSAIFFDYDGDTWPDLYVANDLNADNEGDERLYRNRGDGTFQDVSEAAGILIEVDGAPIMGMGIAAGDFDSDGDLDLFVTNYNADVLWRNNGDGTFTNVALEAGVANEGVGWYAGFVDYDNDALRDLYVVNGNVDSARKTNANRLYHNLGNGRFADVAAQVAADANRIARGATTGDFDNDGDVDFYVINSSANLLLRNDTHNDNHWIKVRLEGRRSNRDGVGTRVLLASGGHTQAQEVICGGGFLGSDSLELEFGLGATTQVDAITLIWPSGVVDTYHSLSVDQTVHLVEGQGETPTAVEPHEKAITPWAHIKKAALYQNFPNPFNPETWIPYRLFEPTPVEFSIYSQDGILIRRFDLGRQSSGQYISPDKALHWDGRNQLNEAASSGVYFYELRAGTDRAIGRMYLLK